MFRNLFALFSTLMLGVGAASAANSDMRELSLQQRIAAAQKTINESMTAAGEPAPSSSSCLPFNDTWRKGWSKMRRWQDRR